MMMHGKLSKVHTGRYYDCRFFGTNGNCGTFTINMQYYITPILYVNTTYLPKNLNM